MRFHRPALLEPNLHHRSELACGETTLDQWLRHHASQNRRHNNAAVWVIADENLNVVCYATLSMTSLDRSSVPQPLAKGAPRQIPALLVGRLATDARFTGLGLATQLVKHILATAAELNIKAAFRAVVVTALNPAAFRWWQRFGFEPLEPGNAASLDLYLPTNDIAASLNRL